MPAALSLTASPAQLSTQLSLAPKSPLIPFSNRMKVTSTSGASIARGSVVSAVVGGRTNGAYASSSAVSQNEAARHHGSTAETTAGLSSELIQSQSDNMALLKLQIAMQRENQVFTAISNILKTRHETLKTIIGNIR